MSMLTAQIFVKHFLSVNMSFGDHALLPIFDTLLPGRVGFNPAQDPGMHKNY